MPPLEVQIARRIGPGAIPEKSHRRRYSEPGQILVASGWCRLTFDTIIGGIATIGIFSGIYARITSALLANAAGRPTHFPAIKSAKDLETGEENPQIEEPAEKQDGPRPR